MGNKSRCTCGQLAVEMKSGEFFCKSCLTKDKLAKGYTEEVKVIKNTKVTKVVHEEIKNIGPGSCVCETPKKKRWWEKLLNYIARGGPPDNCCG